MANKKVTTSKKKKAIKKNTGGTVVAGRREKFHKPTCEWASYLKAPNRREFESPMEARANGLIPCRYCFGYNA
jgi:hypothetical protein